MPKRAPAHRPAKPALPEARANAAARGYGHAWRKLRLWFLRQRPLCLHCAVNGRDEPALHVDHVIAKEKGGTDDFDNLQGLCASCHSRKTVAKDGGFGR